jgi:hypothetical protein
MKKYLLLLLLSNNLYAQNQPFECDNAFETCGTPEQSGGGGGGGSVLINNTDLGDTYQNADDFDDDGIEDDEDNCPRIRNRDQSNSDGDEWGDACDNCPAIENIGQENIDGDSFGDVCDNDIDDDKILNHLDNCFLMYNVNQTDLDKDNIGDACDTDIDNDDIINQSDACPFDKSFNANCNKDFDQDGILDYYDDNLFEDNCMSVYNPEQTDTDADTIGDVCDTDDDNDLIPDHLDNCTEVDNESQLDADKDGLGDECDPLFCYVVFNNEDECLDPSLNLQVYTPSLLAETSQNVKIRVFINKENQKFRYVLSVLNKPNNASVKINKAEDEINTSFNFEYETDSLTFSANRTGEYKLRLTVESLGADLITGELNETITYDFRIVLTGQNSNEASCNATSKETNILFLCLLVIGFVLINRKLLT